MGYGPVPVTREYERTLGRNALLSALPTVVVGILFTYFIGWRPNGGWIPVPAGILELACAAVLAVTGVAVLARGHQPVMLGWLVRASVALIVAGGLLVTLSVATAWAFSTGEARAGLVISTMAASVTGSAFYLARVARSVYEVHPTQAPYPVGPPGPPPAAPNPR